MADEDSTGRPVPGGSVPAYLGRVLTWDGEPIGTCFQVAPGVLVTAWHVLDGMAAGTPGADVWVDELRVGSMQQPATVVRVDAPHDLAVLRVARSFPASVAGLALSGTMSPAAGVHVLGMARIPDEDHQYRFAPAAGTWSGIAMQDGELLAVMESKAVALGMSGAPVRRTGDDRVVGVVSGRYSNPADPWFRDSVWLARVEDLLPLLDEYALPAVDDGLTQVRAYLAAAVLAARTHPYPGVVPGTVPPLLPTVYLQQQVSMDEAGTRIPATGILDLDDDCLVVAGPGMGKSSLLRRSLYTAARQWADGAVGTVVPVRVLAADLTGGRSLPALIADAVTADLGRSWPPEFFAERPRPDVRWLLLVDALDEILEPEARRLVLAKLAGLRHRDQLSPHRVIVTSRPLDQTELAMVSATSGWQPRHYELRGFTLENVGQLATHWFQALGLPDPDAVTARFTADVTRFRLTELAGTPLVASMLCQLRAAAPNADLPTTRGAIYQEFTELLYKRLNARGESGALAQADIALSRYGGDALHGARRTVAALSELIAFLASERRAGNTEQALDIIAAQPAAQRPHGVPADDWRDFLTGALRRSGLLDLRAGEFVFLHETLADYLVARHHADRAGLLREMLRGPRWRRGRWRAPRADASFVSFLLDPGPPHDPGFALVVRRLAISAVARGGLDACEFVATQVRLGTWLPEPIVVTVTGTVERIAAAGTYDSVRAARILADIDRARGSALLESIALARRGARRFEAIREITALDPTRAEPILTSVAEGAEYHAGDHVRAARLLAQLGNPRGGELLLKTATAELLDALDTDSTYLSRADLRELGLPAKDIWVSSDEHRQSMRERAVTAVEALAQVDPDGADALLSGAIAEDAVSADDRAWVTTVLTGIRGRPADPMAGLDRTWLTGQLSSRMVAQVTRRGAPSRSVGHDTTTPVPAGLLASLEDPRAADLLVAIAHNSDESERYRWVAVRQLAQFRDPRATELLLAAIDDPAGPGWRRAQAGSDLVMLGDPRGMAALEAMARDAVFDDRASAVEAIAGWDRQRAARLIDVMYQDIPFWRLDRTLLVRLIRREKLGKHAVH
jgi:hypothetical protein